MARLTHHELLQCVPVLPPRRSHPDDTTLLELAKAKVRIARGYRATRDGLEDDDPGVERAYTQLRAERAVARYLMVPYQPIVAPKSRISGRGTRLTSQQGTPVEVLVRKALVDPKRRASMPELLLPVEWEPRPEIATVFVVWIGSGCEPYLAGWLWEDEIRRAGDTVVIGARVFHRRRVGNLHAMERLVVASPWVRTEQLGLIEELIL